MVNIWNAFTDSVVSSPSFAAFKLSETGLDLGDGGLGSMTRGARAGKNFFSTYARR